MERKKRGIKKSESEEESDQQESENRQLEPVEEEKYESQVSKITGASYFTVLSDFSEVKQAKEHLSKRIIKDEMDQFLKKKYNQFVESETLLDRMSHKAGLQQVIYCKQNEKFIILEEGFPKKFIIAHQMSSQDKAGAKRRTISSQKEKQSQKDQKDMALQLVQEYEVSPEFKKASHILSMAFCDKQQLLGVVASDGRIFFYQNQTKGFDLSRLSFVIDCSSLPIQTTIWYLERHNAWFTAGKDNVLREWAVCATQENYDAFLGSRKDTSNLQVAVSEDQKPGQQVSQSYQMWRKTKFINFRKMTSNPLEEEYFHQCFLVYEFKNDLQHQDTICDMCEIASPQLVVTACLDKIVRLFQLQEKKLIGVFSGHNKGVRQLDYTNYHDGYLISLASENFANVWSLEGGMGAIQSSVNIDSNKRKGGKTSSTSSNLNGKLKNGNNIIKYVRFLPNSPYCASIDDKLNFKMWDFTKCEAMQTIKSSVQASSNNVVNGLICMKPLRRFGVVFKRLLFYDTYSLNHLMAAQKKKMSLADSMIRSQSAGEVVNTSQQVGSSQCPIGAAYNQNNNCFIIVMHSDIRIFSAANG